LIQPGQSPLDKILSERKEKGRQRHPISPENIEPAIGVFAPSRAFKIMQETYYILQVSPGKLAGVTPKLQTIDHGAGDN
jgi:hypothetical protein